MDRFGLGVGVAGSVMLRSRETQERIIPAGRPPRNLLFQIHGGIATTPPGTWDEGPPVMAETFYPPLTEERYAALIRHEIDRNAPPSPAPRINLDDLETLLRAAEERARPRTALPPQLKRFPLAWRPWLQLLILKMYKRLFHDQRDVNTVLIHALRETITVHRYLLSQLAERSQAPLTPDPSPPRGEGRKNSPLSPRGRGVGGEGQNLPAGPEEARGS